MAASAQSSVTLFGRAVGFAHARTQLAADEQQPRVPRPVFHGFDIQDTPRWAVTAAAFYIHVSEGAVHASYDAGSHALPYALGTTYNLDAHTFLYGTVAYVNNSRNGTFPVFATPRDPSSATSPVAGESQTGVYVGMMNTF
ncbi:hypothetical protein RI103_11735 [Paraburkholderia sp. FT54]|uniref:hypothetical protein n=1 Tax=Paraburkholderia sp. FT54 TaxID=3074437 RepID=UPI00287730AC|nr:hypothetical protein [Paraburkholderia sp. FT54]WNC88397.1 hypothetical protein RI103_11735 [Paraburkholderia sp. FT54]